METESGGDPERAAASPPPADHLEYPRRKGRRPVPAPSEEGLQCHFLEVFYWQIAIFIDAANSEDHWTAGGTPHEDPHGRTSQPPPI